MIQPETERCRSFFLSSGFLAVLGGTFLLGGLLGAALSGGIGETAAERLSAYLLDYLTLARDGEVPLKFWPLIWEQGRFFLGAAVLGFTALGVVGIPLMFGIRGFLFAFSVAGFCRIFGPLGLGPALCLFGLPAFLWAPFLFLEGTVCLEGSFCLLQRCFGEGRGPLPYDSAYWGRLILCGAGLLVCVMLEFAAAPVLLPAAARFVL